MLPAASRMRASRDFTLAVRRGRRAGDPLLVTHLLLAETDQHHEPTPARVGFVVSKAVGNAVVRKRVTRRLRHVVRERLDRLPEGSLVVVRALPDSAMADFHALAASFDGTVERVLRPRPHDRGRA